MLAVVEFFGGPAWAAVICFGAIMTIAVAIGWSYDVSNKLNRISFVMFWLSGYFLLVLGIRGAGILILNAV